MLDDVEEKNGDMERGFVPFSRVIWITLPQFTCHITCYLRGISFVRPEHLVNRYQEQAAVQGMAVAVCVTGKTVAAE